LYTWIAEYNNENKLELIPKSKRYYFFEFILNVLYLMISYILLYTWIAVDNNDNKLELIYIYLRKCKLFLRNFKSVWLKGGMNPNQTILILH
jgi:hypothetical protein